MDHNLIFIIIKDLDMLKIIILITIHLFGVLGITIILDGAMLAVMVIHEILCAMERRVLEKQ